MSVLAVKRATAERYFGTRQSLDVPVSRWEERPEMVNAERLLHSQCQTVSFVTGGRCGINGETGSAMGDAIDRDQDGGDALVTAADAATEASGDARAAARSAAEATLAAQEAAQVADEAAAHAKVVTARTFAVAAASTAKIAATTAAAVADEAVSRDEDAVRSAAEARRRVVEVLADHADPDVAASEVARAVAADVIARASATADAAALVAEAVTAAAEAAFHAARSAAASVELAAGKAAAAAHAVSGSSAASQAASDVVVGSTSRFVELASLLRAVAAVRRISLARNPPLVGELRTAVDRAELGLHYQPIYNTGTGALVAVEALLRWQHPSRGLLPPAEFIHVAEHHPDLVNPVGDWVLATAITQAKVWRGEYGGRAPKVWVNVSCDQLGQQRLRGVVESLLHEAGLGPAAIGLDVTERQLIETTGDAAADLAALRDFGVPLALDDFGTGYASLEYLRRFIFDEIKIDQSFVAGLGRDKTDTAVTASIIELGRSLDLAVVAEGVETQEQYDHLKRLGCAMCQGFLLQRPAPPETIAKLLAAQAGARRDAGESVER
jgi:EAL domain-containing protein (putative c-di-GMP-specific phosphodiesterase class I)